MHNVQWTQLAHWLTTIVLDVNSDSKDRLPLERTVLEESTSVSHSGQTVVPVGNGDEMS